jgi:MYXO-CTERM domain-containing protein
MNNIKLLGLTAGVGSLILAGSATADFNGISWTSSSSTFGLFGTTDTYTGDTYLIYADVDAGNEVHAVFGDTINGALNIEGSSAFFQSAYGGHSTLQINSALLGVFSSLAYDSWVTIGLSDQSDNALLNIGVVWDDFEAGGAIWTENGTWFATPDDVQVQEIDGKVLIGQFTVASGEGVSGTLNLQGFDETGETWNAYQVDFNTMPAPGALALLGLAGIAARRRRK